MHNIKTSYLIGAWKCNFPAGAKDIMAERPTDQPTEGHAEVTLPI